MTDAIPSQANGVFQFNIKNEDAQEAVWTIDLKTEGKVYKGEAKPKADLTLLTSDDTLVDIAQGKVCSRSLSICTTI
jgi:putative sterol carrier protein